jgi:hypothetical protein
MGEEIKKKRKKIFLAVLFCGNSLRLPINRGYYNARSEKNSLVRRRYFKQNFKLVLLLILITGRNFPCK